MFIRKLIFICFSGFSFITQAQVWQWSVAVENSISKETNEHPQAFLWVPENCKQVRGLVFTQHNMIEEGMLENKYFRKIMTDIGFAVIWVTPNFSITYDVANGEDKIFEQILNSLADFSGYQELAYAPIVPMGHSALASFPWNFAAFNPERALALISIHGDAPQTNLTGSGRPNPDWGDKNIDGIPSLFIMGEYEWMETRITPAYKYIQEHPESLITLFADAGHGHFDYSDDMVNYVAHYILKAAKERLPEKMPLNDFSKLKKIKPSSGWLMDKWRQDTIPQFPAATFKNFKGDRRTASWVFDKKTAKATENFYTKARGKTNQYVGFKQNGTTLKPQKTNANFYLDFKPLEDGVTFNVSAFFADLTRIKEVENHAKTPLYIDRICGPVKKINDTTFQISFDKLGFNNAKRSNDIWLLAHNKGDRQYKSTVQQLNMRFPLANKSGEPQIINFNAIPNVKTGTKLIKLDAKSSANVKLEYYVKKGPAYLEDNVLHFTKTPPKTKFPVLVTVVAWQYGVSGKLQSAQPVDQSFYITK